jgi:hypothetical protein
MHIEGHVENGQIVLDTPTDLPEGTRVKVEAVGDLEAAKTKLSLLLKSKTKPQKSFAESVAPFVGCLKHLPKDAASKVDYYLEKGLPHSTEAEQ